MSIEKDNIEEIREVINNNTGTGIFLTLKEASDIISILQKLSWKDVNDIIVFLSKKLADKFNETEKNE